MKRKLTALLCLVLSVLLLMPGCAKKTDPGQDPGTDPGETPSQEEPKKEETSKDPISIETEAGALCDRSRGLGGCRRTHAPRPL